MALLPFPSLSSHIFTYSQLGMLTQILQFTVQGIIFKSHSGKQRGRNIFQNQGGQISVAFSVVLSSQTPRDPDVPPLSMCTKDSIDICSAALSTIDKKWNRPRCPSTDERIVKNSTYTVEYYSVVKKDDIMSFAATWMELEKNILSDVTQSQIRQTSHVLSRLELLVPNLQMCMHSLG